MKLTDSIKQNISIVEYAERIGLTPVRKSNNRYTLKEHDSLIIRPEQNLFSWNSQEKGGSIIDFAMEMKGLTLDAAYTELRSLLSNSDFVVPKAKRAPPQPKATKAAEVTFPTAFDGQYKRLYGYLCKGRAIAPEVVTDMIKRDYLYEDTNHNAVFKGYDYDGIAKYGFRRGTMTTGEAFRGELAGTNEFNKQVGLYINNDAKSLFVSEAAIDNLSLMTLLHINGRDYNSYNYLSLGGTYVDCLKYHLTQPQNAKINLIYLATDNDKSGSICRDETRKMLKEIGYKGTVKDKTPLSKDWNNDLQNIKANSQQKQQSIQQIPKTTQIQKGLSLQ